jgi:signal peptidase II
MNTKNLHWLWISVFIIVCDQIAKIIVARSIGLGQGIELNSYINLVHAHNYGAAFSFLDIRGGGQRWIFTTISIVASVLLIVWLMRTPSSKKWQSLSLSLIIGGALGNFWDRFAQGYVIDFLDFHYKGLHWPAFNIADSAVSLGAVILICLLVFGKQ